MKRVILSVVFVIFSFSSFSQNLIWEKLFDYTLNGQDGIDSFDETLDSNIIFCNTYPDVYFVKCDLNGNVIWEEKRNSDAHFSTNFIKQLKNGQLIHYGNAMVPSSGSSILSRMDSEGNVLGSWYYGSKNYYSDFESLVELSDGNYLAAGESWGSNASIALSLTKIDTSMKQVWRKLYNKRIEIIGTSVLVNQKGNYIVYGDAATNTENPYFEELTPNGDSIQANIIHIKTGTTKEEMAENAAIVTTDGNYIIVARVDTNDGMGNILKLYAGVVLLDTSFNIKWKCMLKPLGTQWYYTSTISQLKDSSYVVVVNNINPNNNQYFLYNISKTGQILNQKTFTSSICNAVHLNAMKILSDGSLVVSGACLDGENAYIARIGGVGLPAIADTCKTFTASFRTEQQGNTLSYINTSNGGYAYAWKSEWTFSDSSTSPDFKAQYAVTGTIDSVWARLVATNPYGCKDTVSKKVAVISVPVTDTLPLSTGDFNIIVSPNPATDYIDFKIVGEANRYKLVLNNCLGQQVGTHELESKEFKLSLKNFSSGMYFYKITQDTGSSGHGKFLKE